MLLHPCLRCGACCAYFRVAFHWSESAVFLDGQVPEALTARLDPHRVHMLGTSQRQPRCVALKGSVGLDASCSIYARRPSVCRELVPSWEQGTPSPQCDRARQAHGLAPLGPADWIETPDAPLPRSA